MVDIDTIKYKLNDHKVQLGNRFTPTYSTKIAYDFVVICEELVKEIEQLRQDLREMYALTKE